MVEQSQPPSRRPAFHLLLGGSLLGAVLLVPWAWLLEAAAARFNTVRNFRDDFETGLVWFRLALTCNGLAALAWPTLLRWLWPPEATASPRPHDRRDLAVMGGLFAGALILRCIGLDKSLQHDEWHIWFNYVQHGPLVAVTRYNGLTNHIFSTVMAWAGTKLLGVNEIGIRASSVLFSALGPALLYGALRCRFTRVPSAVGGAVYACSAFALMYSQEARAYAYVLFCMPALLWLAEELRHRPSPRVLAAAVAVSTLLIYTRLVNFVVCFALVLGAAAGLLLEHRKALPAFKRNLLVFLLTGLASFQLYAITFAGIFRTLRGEHPASTIEYPALESLLPGYLTVGFAPVGVAPAAWGLALGGLGVLLRRSASQGLSVLAVAGISLWYFGPALSVPRYQIQLLAGVVLASAAGLAWLLERKGPARAAGMLGAGLLLLAQGGSALRYHAQDKLDFKGAAAWIEAQGGSGRVGTHVDSKTVSWYLKDSSRWTYVEAKRFEEADPEWFVAHTVTLAGDAALAEKLRRAHVEVWRKPTMWGFDLTIWKRQRP